MHHFAPSKEGAEACFVLLSCTEILPICFCDFCARNQVRDTHSHTSCRPHGDSKHRKPPPANRDHEHSPSIRCAAIAFGAVRGSGLCRSTMRGHVRVARGRGPPGERHCLGLGCPGAGHAGGYARGVQLSFARHVGDAVSMPAAPISVLRPFRFVVKTGACCDFSRRFPAGARPPHAAKTNVSVTVTVSYAQLAQSRQLYAAHAPHLQGQHHPPVNLAIY
jgi:hypothetical protein